MNSTGTTRILERPERSRLFRAAARVLIYTLPTLLAPPAQAGPRPASAPAPAVRWAPPPVPPAPVAPTSALGAPAWPAARAAVPSRVPAPPPLAPPRTATAPDVGRTPAERADTPLPERRVEDDPRLRRLPSARLPWLHAPAEALLAALAATPSAGDAPALVREATLPAGWSLVSVPLLASNTQASSVFGALPAPPRVYDYAGGRTLGLGEPGFRTVVPGRAFWVLLKQPQVLSLSGLAINPTVEARLPLVPGWNTLATPWLSRVEWSDARVSVRVGSETVLLGEAVTRGWIGSDLYQYDPATAGFVSFAANAVPAGELRVWEGSAVFASVTGELVLQPPPPDTQPPAISLNPPPVEGQEITAPLDIVGTIDDPNLAEWRLELAPAGTSTFTTFAAGGAPVTNGVLGTLDPTGLLNGQYQVRLVATDVFGQSSIIAWTVVVKGDLKIGNFSMSFVDLEVPVAGLPIRLTRTYDSRDKGRGDFGIGWRLDLSSIRVGENGPSGAHWLGTRSGGILPTWCVQPARAHVVTLTLPDGEVLEFQPSLAPQCQQIIPPTQVTLSFTALPGTQGTLAPLDADLALIAGGWPASAGETTALDLVDFDTGTYIDPDLYRLTLPDGRAFVVHQRNGLQSITDLNGNQLVFGPGGITHNSGAGVVFTRDGLGRITKITDPNGDFSTYTYDANGDLVSWSDPEGHATTCAYNGSHGLLSLTDPLGRQPLRSDYDAAGRLIRTTDALGRATEYTHDVAGRRQTVTDRLGGVRVLEYDARGNLVREVDQAGNAVVRSYDARGNLLSETDAEGHVTTRSYDARDNVTSLGDGEGNVTTFSYNARNQVLATTDPLGRVTTRAYDARGNLTSVTAPGGLVTGFTYDARGNELTRTDPLGQVTRRAYDAAGNRVKETDPSGHETAYAYDGTGRVLARTTTRTDAGVTRTLTTAHVYDRAGRLVQTTHADGSLARMTHDALGRPLTREDGLGRVTAFAYDAMGRLASTTFADGTVGAHAYDAEGRVTATTDRAGRATLYEYDAVGRQTRVVHPDGSSVQTHYDRAGRPVALVDARGHVTQQEFDAAGRRVRVVDPTGAAFTFAYDAAGNLTALTDALGRATAYEYDAFNRRVKTILPDGSFATEVFDAAGRLAARTDQAGRATQFAYDALGRLTSVTDALGQVTAYAYDEVGNRVSQTDAAGRTTRFEYDALWRLKRRTLPDGAYETLTWDAAGNLTSVTDFAGATTTYTYDGDDRLLRRTHPDGSFAAFTYTPTGRRATATDARGTTSYAYDARDRLVSRTEPDGRRLDYAYDAQGNRIGLSVSVGGFTLTQSFSYDALDRVQGAHDPLGRAYAFAYDANGNLASLSQPDGSATTYTYDALNRLTQLVTAGPHGIVQGYALTLAANGQRTRIADAGGAVHDYGYDALHRLTRETLTASGADFDTVFTYDAVGNRLSRTRTAGGTTDATVYGYDARDRLLTENLTAYGYDADGRLTSKSGEATYAWDYEHRLVRVGLADGTVVEHAYDADGNRVRTRVTTPGGTPAETHFLVDTAGELAHVLAESDAAGTLGAFYVRAGDHLLALMRPDGAGGWTTRHYHADALGSVRALTDETGAVTDRYAYTAFGEPLLHLGVDPQPYAFAGEPYDPGAAFAYHRARWLDPRNGRFLGLDPFEGLEFDPVTLHRYLYAGADPVNRVDPEGRSFYANAMITLTIIGILSNLYGLQANLRGLINADTDAERLKYAVDAGLNILGLFLAFTGWSFTGGLPQLATAGGGVAVGVPYLVATANNAKLIGSVLIPVGQAIGGVFMASSAHQADWELRDSGGRIRTRGTVESGGTSPGRRLTWAEQLTVHTERKILDALRQIVKKGDIVTIRGTKPPCNPGGQGCANAMAEFAAEMGVKIKYTNITTGEVWIFP